MLLRGLAEMYLPAALSPHNNRVMEEGGGIKRKEKLHQSVISTMSVPKTVLVQSTDSRPGINAIRSPMKSSKSNNRIPTATKVFL